MTGGSCKGERDNMITFSGMFEIIFLLQFSCSFSESSAKPRAMINMVTNK